MIAIYEGTNGLRGLIGKLIEVWSFKKVVIEDSGSISDNNAVFRLYITDDVFLRGQFTDTEVHGWCDLRTETLIIPFIEITSSTSDQRRWVIYKTGNTAAFGLSKSNIRPAITAVIGETENYVTGEKSFGIVTAHARNTNQSCCFNTGMQVTSVWNNISRIQKAVTSLVPVVDPDMPVGFTNVYHVISHSTGEEQEIMLNGKKFFCGAFAFEDKG